MHASVIILQVLFSRTAHSDSVYLFSSPK